MLSLTFIVIFLVAHMCYSTMISNGLVSRFQQLSSSAGNLGVALNSNDYFGNSIAQIGDLDLDGVPDVVVGAYGDNSNTGAIYVLFMNRNGTVKNRQKITYNVGNFLALLNPYDFFWVFCCRYWRFEPRRDHRYCRWR